MQEINPGQSVVVKIPWGRMEETHCPAVSARINTRRPVMVGDRWYWTLFRAVSATRLVCILSTCIHSPQQLHFKHTSLVGLLGEPTQKSGSEYPAAHHLTKQQRHLGQSEAHPYAKLIFKTSRGIALALEWHKSNSWLSHMQSPIHKKWEYSLQVGIFVHLQVFVFIYWWFPHRLEFYKRHMTEWYDSGLHGIWVKSSIFGPNTTENKVMTKLYNRIVSA